MADNKFLKKQILGGEEGEPLPPNRKSQFFSLLKDNFGRLFFDNIIITISCVPLLAFLFFMNSSYSSIDSPSSGDTMSYVFTAYSCSIPLIMVAALGVLSVIFHLKRLVVGQSPDLSGILYGFKKHWLMMLIVGLAFGMSIFITEFGCTYYLLSSLDSFWKYLLFFLLIVCFLLFFTYLSWLIGFFFNYEAKTKDQIKNAFSIFGKNLLPSLLFSLTVCLVFFCPFVFKGAIEMLFMSIILIILSSPALLSFQEYQAFVFDKDINATMFPESYKRGLSK